MKYFVKKDKPWELFMFLENWTETETLGVKISSSRLDREIISTSNTKFTTLDQYYDQANCSEATLQELKQSINENMVKYISSFRKKGNNETH